MATIKITLADTPGGVTTLIESDPDIMLLDNGDPDMENLSPAQALSIAVMMQIAERFEADWRVFFRD